MDARTASSLCKEKLFVSVEFNKKYLSKIRSFYRHFQTTKTKYLPLVDFTEGNFKIHGAGRSYMIPDGWSGIQERVVNKDISINRVNFKKR